MASCPDTFRDLWANEPREVQFENFPNVRSDHKQEMPHFDLLMARTSPYDFFIAGDQEEPATLISTLIGIAHMRQVFGDLGHRGRSSAFLWTSTKNKWNEEDTTLLITCYCLVS